MEHSEIDPQVKDAVSRLWDRLYVFAEKAGAFDEDLAALKERRNFLESELEKNTSEIERLSSENEKLAGENRVFAQKSSSYEMNARRFENALAAAYRRIEELENENARLSGKTSEIENLRAELAETKKLAENVPLPEDFEELFAKRREFADNHSKKIYLFHKLTEEFELLKKSVAEKNFRLKELHDEILKRNNSISDLKKRIFALEKDLDSATQYQPKIEAIEKEKAELREELEIAGAEFEEYKNFSESKIARLSEELSDMMQLSERHEEHIFLIENEYLTNIDELQLKYNSIELEKYKLSKKLQELESKPQKGDNRQIFASQIQKLKIENEYFVKKLSDFEKEIATARAENDELRVKTDSIEASLKRRHDEELRKYKKISDLQDKALQKFSEESLDLKFQAREKDTAIRELRKQVGEISAKVEEQTALREKLAAAENKIRSLDESVAEYEARIESLEKENASLELLRENVKTLESDKREYESAIAKFQEEKVKIEKKYREATVEAAEIEKALNELADEKTKMIDEFSNEESKLRSEISRLRDDVTAINAELVKYQEIARQKEALEENIRKNQSEIANLKSETLVFRNQSANAWEIVKEKEFEISELKKETLAKEDLIGQYEDIFQEYQDLKKENSEMKRELEKLDSRAKTAQELIIKYETAEKEIASLKEDLSEKMGEIEDLNVKIDNYKEMTRVKQREIDSYKAESESASRESVDKNQLASRLDNFLSIIEKKMQ